MIETIEDNHSWNMDELLSYLLREKEQRYSLWAANEERNPERAKREKQMSEHYQRMYEAARFYRKAPEGKGEGKSVKLTEIGYEDIFKHNHLEIIKVPSCTFLFYEPIKMIKKILDEDVIGKILAFQYHMGQYLPLVFCLPNDLSLHFGLLIVEYELSNPYPSLPM